MKKYTEFEAQQVILQAGGKIAEGHIQIKSGSLGLRKLGAVDFLVNRCRGYWVTWLKV